MGSGHISIDFISKLASDILVYKKLNEFKMFMTMNTVKIFIDKWISRHWRWHQNYDFNIINIWPYMQRSGPAYFFQKVRQLFIFVCILKRNISGATCNINLVFLLHLCFSMLKYWSYLFVLQKCQTYFSATCKKA